MEIYLGGSVMLTLKTSNKLAGILLIALSLLANPVLAAEMAHAATDWLAPLDHYCERVAVGLWNEPLNASSNIAFLIAAAVILVRQQRADWSAKTVAGLATLAGIVGVGSILFHTFANRWSLIADMLPIAVFIYAYFFVGLCRFLGFGALAAGLAAVGLYFASPAIEALLRPILGASVVYTPGLIATLGLAIAVPALRRGPVPRLLLAAGFAFAGALTFRMLDQPLCGILPSGTHFLWHLFNGVAIGLALLAAERAGLKETKFVGSGAGFRAAPGTTG